MAGIPNGTGDTATFSNPLNGAIGGASDPVLLNASAITLQNLTFSGSAGAYVIGTNAGLGLILRGGGSGGTPSFGNSINMAAAVTNAEVVAAPISFSAPSSTTIGYTFKNDSSTSSATLTISGAITTNTATNRHTTISLDGSNTGANTISGVISATGSTQGNAVIQKVGNGTWILSGANTLTANSMTNTGGAQGIQVNAGVLSAQNNAALGTSGTANNLNTWINSGGTLQLANSITLDNGVSLNLKSGGTIRSSGSTTTNGRINVGTAAATSVTLSTVGSSDVFTIGNGTNDLTGGASDSVINVGGPGTIYQNVASNYAGGWSINSGTLKLGSATALGLASSPVAFGASSTGKLQLNGNSVTIGSLSSNATVGAPVVENGVAGTTTLTVGGSSSTSYEGVLQNGTAGVLALAKSGTGTLNLTGANTYSGATTISGGTLKVNNLTGTSATGTSAVSVSATGTLGGSGFISGAVTVNNGGIIAPGNSVGTLTVGALTLSSGSILNYEFNTSPANDYINVTNSGGLTINGGGFNLYDEGTLNAFSTLNTYNLIGYSGSIGGLGVSSLSVLNPQPGKSYTFGATGTSVTLGISLSGVISDWTLNGDGSWNTAGNWSGAVPNGSGETANFTFALTSARSITLDGTKTVGGISFNGGASPLGYGISAGSGGTLAINNGLSQANIIVTTGANSISADVSLDSSNTVAAIASGSSLEISGSIGGTGSLAKSGPGSVNITNTSNSYAGSTGIYGGTLGFAALGSLGGGSLTIDGGTLRYNTGNTADVSVKTVTIGIGGAVIDTNGNDVAYANAIGNGGAGNFTKNGAGVLTMQGNNTFTGSTTVNGGSLILSGTSATTGGTVINGANTLLSIGSDGALGAVPGAATTNLTLNPGAGNSATLKAGASFAMSANRSVSIPNGTSIIDTNGYNLTIAGNFSGSALLRKTGSGNLTLTGANSGTASGGITIDAGTVFLNDQSNLPSGSITLNGTAGISNGSNAASYNNVVVNGANFIVKTGSNNILGLGSISGSGTLTFGGSYVNDFTGSMSGFTGTIIANAGGSRWFGSVGGSNVTLDLANTGTSVRSSATGITLGALAGTSSAILSGSGGGVTQAVTYSIGGKTVGGLGVTPVSSIFNGSITNGANTTSINKVGLSTLTLNGTSTYTGTTTVSAGTLLVNGSLGNTAVAVNSGGTLGGSSGTIGTGTASLTVNNGGTLAPGNSPGSLTVNGSTTLNSGSNFAYQFTGGGLAADLVDINGTLTINGATLVLENLGIYNIGDKFTLFAYDSLTSGSIFTGYADDSSFAFSGNDWLINYDDSTAGLNGGTGAGYVTITAVPEPGAALLGGLGLLALLRRRRN